MFIGRYHAAELKYEKLFVRLSARSETDELRASLSADRNELAQQRRRTAQVMKSLKVPAKKELSGVDGALLENGKDIAGGKRNRGTRGSDVFILGLAKEITFLRIARLGTLVAICRELGSEPAAVLLEQSLSECRNTVAYFGQIEQNIIYPGIGSGNA